MSPSTSDSVSLKASQQDGPRPLASEEGADFSLVLQNDSASPVTVRSIDNISTARYTLFDSAGRTLGPYDAAERRERVVGHTGTRAVPPPTDVTLGPGETEELPVGMWAFRDPLPPGKYSFVASHELKPGTWLDSPRVPFEIFSARVESMALSFDGPARLNSVMAWVSKMEGAASPRLLIRQSGFTGHRVAQVGGTANGEFAERSLVALSAMPVDARFPPHHWAAVISGSAAHLVQHSMTLPSWRSSAVPLNVSGAIPIQRFPNRGYAIFLATAVRGSEGVLIGAVIKSGDSSPRAWSLPLKAKPVHAACAFEMEGAITVLYSSTEGGASRLHRISVSEDGQVVKAEMVARETPNRVLAVVADMRPGQPLSFVALEEDPARANFLGFSRIPVDGPVAAVTPREIPGWPMSANGVETAPDRIVGTGFDLDVSGMPWLAFTLADGRFYGGRLDGPVAKLLEDASRCSFPQVAGIAKSMTLSCFLEDGMMFHSGGGSGH